MKLKIFASIFIALFAVASGFGQNAAVLAKAQLISGDTFRFETHTQKGAAIYAASKPSNAVLKAVDKGLTDLFAIARKNGYSRKLNYSDYSIYIAKPDRLKNADGQYSPDIAVNAGQYAGSIYDKGGYIYAAGMVIYNNPCAFLIGEHSKNLERVSEIVRYEGEHLVIYHNDRQRYNATADHSRGGGHPILQ